MSNQVRHDGDVQVKTDSWQRGTGMALGVLALAALTFGSVMLLLIPASHDELHFAHAAWLAQQGQKPFADFLYHNSTGILYLLRICGAWNPEFGPEVIWWGRTLSIASLWLTAALLFWIGTQVDQPRVGLLAVALVVPIVVIPYNGETFRKQHWAIRPEVFVMPLAFGALSLTLHVVRRPKSAQNGANADTSQSTIADADRPLKDFAIAMAAAASAGGALFVSPRLVFLCLGLVVLVLIERRAIRRWTWLGFLIGASVAPVLYFWLIGFDDAYLWIYKYVKYIRTSDQGRFTWLRMHPGKFFLAISALQCAYYLWRRRPTGMFHLAIVQAVLLSPGVLEPVPSFPTWQVNFPIAGVFFASLCIHLADRRTWLAWGAAFCLLGAGWAYPARGIAKNFAILRRPEMQLATQLAGYQRLCDVLAAETVLVDPAYHPVAAHDASYFWTQFARLRPVMAQAGITQPPLSLIDDCVSNPPAILWRDALDQVAESAADKQIIDRLIADRYRPTPSGLLVRQDIYERLAPMLESPDVAPHISAR